MTAQAELSEQVQRLYPGIRFAVVSCPALDDEFAARVGSLVDGISGVLDERAHRIDTAVASFDAFFTAAGHRCPLPGQLASARKKGLPSAPVLVRALLYAELTTGVLMGVHEAAAIGGNLVLDAAAAGERFQGIGSPITCGEHEPVVRDESGTIASLFQGPDARTRVGEATTAPVFSVFSTPDLDGELFDDAIRTLRHLLAPNAEVAVRGSGAQARNLNS